MKKMFLSVVALALVSSNLFLEKDSDSESPTRREKFNKAKRSRSKLDHGPRFEDDSDLDFRKSKRHKGRSEERGSKKRFKEGMGSKKFEKNERGPREKGMHGKMMTDHGRMQKLSRKFDGIEKELNRMLLLDKDGVAISAEKLYGRKKIADEYVATVNSALEKIKSLKNEIDSVVETTKAEESSKPEEASMPDAKNEVKESSE